jgi:alpha-amylase
VASLVLRIGPVSKSAPMLPLIVLLAAFWLAQQAMAGVLLQAYYQLGDAGVPSSDVPHDPASEVWRSHLARQADRFRSAEFTAVWLPPVNKGASGTASLGFHVFDDWCL